MRRFIVGLPALLAFLATAAAADVAPAEAAQTAQAATGSSRSGTQTGPAAASTSARKIVCLNVSLQCFAVRPLPQGASSSVPARVLDLRAPDIRNHISEAELRQRVEADWEIREREDTEQVRVEGARPDVYVPPGIASLPWALRHPTQAWRIFLPVPGSQTK